MTSEAKPFAGIIDMDKFMPLKQSLRRLRSLR